MQSFACIFCTKIYASIYLRKFFPDQWEIPTDEELSPTSPGWAAKYGRFAMVELLLKHEADPNLPLNNLWATPVAWARRRGHEQIAVPLENTKI